MQPALAGRDQDLGARLRAAPDATTWACVQRPCCVQSSRRKDGELAWVAGRAVAVAVHVFNECVIYNLE